MEISFGIGLIVSAVMGIIRRLWPRLFADDADWAKFKRWLTSGFLALAGTVVVFNAAGWEGFTIVGFILAWLTAWSTSQLAHNSAKLIPV